MWVKLREAFGTVGDEVMMIGALNLVIEAVELLPHFGADLFADLAGVVTGGDDAADDGGAVGLFVAEVMKEALRAHVAGGVGIEAEGGKDAGPASEAGLAGLFEFEVEVDADEAGGIFGALEVAAHPVKAVSDS
jgi:hypothetical protein